MMVMALSSSFMLTQDKNYKIRNFNQLINQGVIQKQGFSLLSPSSTNPVPFNHGTSSTEPNRKETYRISCSRILLVRVIQKSSTAMVELRECLIWLLKLVATFIRPEKLVYLKIPVNIIKVLSIGSTFLRFFIQMKEFNNKGTKSVYILLLTFFNHSSGNLKKNLEEHLRFHLNFYPLNCHIESQTGLIMTTQLFQELLEGSNNQPTYLLILKLNCLFKRNQGQLD